MRLAPPYRWNVALLVGIALLMCARAWGDTALEQAETDPDFLLQGEYQGTIVQGDRRDVPAGAQVVAQADGRFAAILFVGGLPGAGWKPGGPVQRAKGRTGTDKTNFHGDDFDGTLADGKLSLTAADGSPLGVLARVERESPTLGQAAPPGAIVLFDGTSTDRWIGGRLVEGHDLAAGAVSKASFGDCQLHLEFCLPFMPWTTGQGRGNSGVYLQNRYELQVLDSFGLDGAANECGALYSVRPPDVNMCWPPLRWQTYDVDFTSARYDAARNKTQNARLTLRHNGVTVHDNLEIAGPTRGGLTKEYPGRGPLLLQFHLAAVTYRNIWLVEKNRTDEK